MGDLESLHRKGLAQIDEFLALTEDAGPFARARTPVSGWCALEHAEHIAKADDASLRQLEQALERSRAGEAGPRIRLAGRLALALGWIPRGVGKAPPTARPEGIDPAEVAEALRRARERVEALRPSLDEIAAADGRASHPVFGGLTPAQWVRFLWMHHHHHLKIVRDIRKAYGEGGV